MVVWVEIESSRRDARLPWTDGSLLPAGPVDCRQLAAAVMLAACCGMERETSGERNHLPRQQAGRTYSGSKLHAVHGGRLPWTGVNLGSRRQLAAADQQPAGEQPHGAQHTHWLGDGGDTSIDCHTGLVFKGS